MGRARGQVIAPVNAGIRPHELRCAKAIASAGHSVEFLARVDGHRVKTPDLVINGAMRGLKSPESPNLKSLQRILRRAGAQSRNAIIDTARGQAVRRRHREGLRKLLPLTKSVKMAIMVAKDGSIVDIGRADK